MRFLPVFLFLASGHTNAPYYVSEGRGEPTVLFVHGWTCDSSLFKGQIDELSRKFRVIAMDLPGHGRTPLPAGSFTPRTFTDALEEVLNAAKVKKAVLAGHSMGGVVIRAYARIHPDRVLGLIFLDSMFQMEDTPEMHAFPSQFEGAKGLEARRKMIEGMFVDATSPALREKILSVMLKPPDSVAVASMAWMVDELTKPPEKINPPSLILVQDGGKCPPTDMFAKTPRFAAVKGTGHFLMCEKSHEVNSYISAFLADFR